MKEYFDIILNDYLKDDDRKTNRNKSYHKALLNDLPNQIKKLIQDDNFIIKGSYGQATKADCPWLCIFHKNITTTAKKGVYICYLFRSDMSGFYLTLSQGITFFKQEFGKEKYNSAEKTVEYFQKELYSNIFNREIIDLKSQNSQLAKGYEHTTIISKFYLFNSYTDEELISDLHYMVHLYRELYRRIKYISYEKLVNIMIRGNKEMLENEPAEFILKLHHEIYPLDHIAKLYRVTRKELDKIRKEKGISNIIFENILRDVITIINYFDQLYSKVNSQIRMDMIRYLCNEFTDYLGHKDFYYERLLSNDWSRKNIKKMIEEKGIDIKYRNVNLEGLYDMLQRSFFDDTELSIQRVPVIRHRPVERGTSVQINRKIYPRSSRVSNRALQQAGYFCEIDSEHPSFIKRSNHQRYMEPHHLIPMEFQGDFTYSLDVEANIVSLCSNCHNEIHYGVNSKKLIKKLYEMRKESLAKCGLEVNIAHLYHLYKQIENDIIIDSDIV